MTRWILALMALTANAGPIYITGSGNYFIDQGSSNFTWDLTFSGSDGDQSTSGYFYCQGFRFSCLGQQYSPMGVNINGAHFGPGLFSWGGTSLTGFDAQHQAVVTVQLEYTSALVSETCQPFNPLQSYCQGRFALVDHQPIQTTSHAPEPGAVWLVGLGLALACNHYRRRL